jgi:hypothetical protein
MTPADYRTAIGDAICAVLVGRAGVAALWEGGSAATGRLDEYSDIDSSSSSATASRVCSSIAPETSGQCRSITRHSPRAGPRGSCSCRAQFPSTACCRKGTGAGHPLEALGFYQALLRALIELLGMRHRPDRFDYGWRYVESELPADAQALIRRYAFVADGTALRQKSGDLGAELTRQLELVSA